MADIRLSESQQLLISLAISNLIREILNRVADMTDEQVSLETAKEMARKANLMAEVDSH